MAKDDFPESYKDPVYASLDAASEQKYGLPVGLLDSVRSNGERSNHSATNTLGTATVYQFIPSTRKAILDKYGIDVTLSPRNASEGAALLLKEASDRNGGDPAAAVGEYIGGLNRDNWGKATKSYINRVMVGQSQVANNALSGDFAKWMTANPATPASPTQSSGKASGADPADSALSKGFAGWLAGQDQIPGTPVPADRLPVSTAFPQAPAPQAPSIIDSAIGTGEAVLNAATGMTGGLAGMIGGTAKGITQSILDGSFGTPEAQRLVEQAAAKGAESLTYAPRTQSGQDQAAVVGNAMQNLIPIAGIAHTLPPMMSGAAKGTPAGVMARAGVEGVARDAADLAAKPIEAAGLVAPGAAGDMAASAAAAGTNAVVNGASRVATLAKGVTTLPRRALERLTVGEDSAPTPGTKASGGAAGTDMATMRKATADQLPVPMGDLLTKGDLTRDPAQQKFEVETAKLSDEGKPLRDRQVLKNQKLLDNADILIDQTGAVESELRPVGGVVDKVLVDKVRKARAEIRARYKAAENAGEMEAPVVLQSVIDHLNDAAPEAATAPLITTARALAIKLGIAKDEGGILVPAGKGVVTDALMNQVATNPGVSLRRAELFRQAINRATDYEATNIRQATIIKGLVDEATQGMGGDLYKAARAKYARFMQEFENHSVIDKLVNNKRGTTDRQVALEDIYKHTMVSGSLDDMRVVHAVLRRAGEPGRQAWRELQGAVARDIKDAFTQSVAPDSAGNRVVSPAALDKAVKAWDKDGKLEFVFGKKGAQTWRDVREVAQISRTVSPESAVNHSNTASNLAAAFDLIISGMMGGPVPVAMGTRMALKHIKDVRLRKRISDALNELPKQAPNNKRGAPHIQTPSRTIH